MKRTITILLLALAVVAFAWASASTASAGGYIEDLTLRDLHGEKVGKTWREGLYTGVFLALMSSEGMSCKMMSANMLIAGVESALSAKEITLDWKIYTAVIYVLVRAGCTATTEKEKTNV